MENVLAPLKNAWKIQDLRKKIFMVVLLLVLYRVGVYIPVPGLSGSALANMVSSQGSLLGFMDILAGGAFQKASIFAMSITPYINASIIMQLLTIAIPRLEQLSKEGEEGRKIIAQWIRYGTVVLGFVEASAMYIGFSSAVTKPGIWAFLTITLSLTAGTAFIMWLGEQINQYGIGNGISMIIFVNIISRGPSGVRALIDIIRSYNDEGRIIVGIIIVVSIFAVFTAVVAFVIWVTQAERRIPVQYAKRVVGRKMYGGQSTHIPMKVNVSGVIPIIFAMSILAFPATIINLVAPQSTGIWSTLRNFNGGMLYTVLLAVFVMLFTFFYTVLVFNPIELANNIRKNGGFIPGIRPGKPTSDYISKVLNRITWFGALFLALITIFPSILQGLTNVQGLWFGGTSLLIMVGVALDTMKQIESQLLMRHYKGFLE